MDENRDGCASLVVSMALLSLHVRRKGREAAEDDCRASIAAFYHGALVTLNVLMEAFVVCDASLAVAEFDKALSELNMGIELMESGMDVKDVIDIIDGIKEGSNG